MSPGSLYCSKLRSSSSQPAPEQRPWVYYRPRLCERKRTATVSEGELILAKDCRPSRAHWEAFQTCSSKVIRLFLESPGAGDWGLFVCVRLGTCCTLTCPPRVSSHTHRLTSPRWSHGLLRFRMFPAGVHLLCFEAVFGSCAVAMLTEASSGRRPSGHEPVQAACPPPIPVAHCFLRHKHPHSLSASGAIHTDGR